MNRIKNAQVHGWVNLRLVGAVPPVITGTQCQQEVTAWWRFSPGPNPSQTRVIKNILRHFGLWDQPSVRGELSEPALNALQLCTPRVTTDTGDGQCLANSGVTRGSGQDGVRRGL